MIKSESIILHDSWISYSIFTISFCTTSVVLVLLLIFVISATHFVSQLSQDFECLLDMSNEPLLWGPIDPIIKHLFVNNVIWWLFSTGHTWPSVNIGLSVSEHIWSNGNIAPSGPNVHIDIVKGLYSSHLVNRAEGRLGLMLFTGFNLSIDPEVSSGSNFFHCAKFVYWFIFSNVSI